MPNRGTVIAILLSLVIAFLWGFKQDLSFGFFSKSQTSIPEPLPEEAHQAPTAPSETKGNTSTTSASSASMTFPGPPVRQNTLSNTLDSIRPGQIPPAQVTQRNEYFEKLSQQLRELQGGTPPPPTVPNENPPPIPPPGAPPVEGRGPSGPIAPPFPAPFQDNTQPVPAQAIPQADFDQQTRGVEVDEDESDTGDEDEGEDAPEAEIEP